MTSEERWIRIENALQTVAEGQAHHEAQIERNAAQIAQNAAAMRDLFVHSRQTDERFRILAQNMITLVHKVDDLNDAVHSHDGRLNDLSDLVRSHDEMMTALGHKIDILVDTVDRIIRRDAGNSTN